MQTVPVAILGGGIAGLTLCAALRQSNINALVFERQENPRQGAGIFMPPNALQILDKLGLNHSLLEAGELVQRFCLSDSQTGLLQSLSLTPLIERFGFPLVALHRHHLHRILLDAANPAQVHFGSAPTTMQRMDGAWVLNFANREQIGTPLLIGADGIHSTLRQQIAPHSRLRYSGQGCYRGLLTATMPESERGSTQEIFAPGRRFGYGAIGGGVIYWFATFDMPQGTGPPPPESRRDHTLALASGFPATVRHLTEATPPHAVLFNRIEDLPQPVWSGDGAILVGDAAHPVTPDFGQGGAQAIEDAFVLANAIHADPQTAALRYTAARKDKVRSILREAHLYGRMSHLRNPVLRFLRNEAIRRYPRGAQTRKLAALFTV